jgi:hypothetical protein
MHATVVAGSVQPAVHLITPRHVFVHAPQSSGQSPHVS